MHTSVADWQTSEVRRRAMRLARCLTVVVACLVVAGDAIGVAAAKAAGPGLPLEVQSVLKRHKLPSDSIGVVVQELATGRVLIGHNIERAYNPASTMKLVTTLAALERFSPAHRWKTHLFVVPGDVPGRTQVVYWQGRGDPMLVSERIWLLTQALRNHDVDVIADGLVFDNDYFALKPAERASIDGKDYRAYNTYPHPAISSFNALTLSVIPRVGASAPKIVLNPRLSGLSVVNRMKLHDGRCRDLKVRFEYRPGDGRAIEPSIELHGKQGRHCREYTFIRAFMDPAEFTERLFRSVWQQAGGKYLPDPARKPVFGTVPAALKPTIAFPSLPLRQIVAGVNKHSNNLMARQLFLNLGASDDANSTSLEAARLRVNEWLGRHGVVRDPFYIDNGAGLSRKVRMSARDMSALLALGFNSRFRPEFIASLPLASLDGSMRKRLKASRDASRLHIKTGLLNDVRAMAGYAALADGRWLSVVSLQNYPDVDSGVGTKVQDALLRWILAQ